MLLALLTLLSAAIAAAVAIGAYRKRPDDLALPLAALMLAVVAWATPHAIGKLQADLGWVLLFTNLQYPGLVAAPLCYLVVAMTYAGYGRYVTWKTIGALSILPIISVLMVWSNPLHGLVWTSVDVDTIYGAAVLVTDAGPYFYLHLAYLYILTAAGIAILGQAVITSGRAYRKEAILMFLGGLIPLAVNIAVNTGLLADPALDPTAPALSISGVLFALALFRFNLIDVSELARRDLVDHLEDGVIVVGVDGRVIDYNRTAATIVEGLEDGSSIRKFIDPEVIADGGLLTVEEDIGVTTNYQPRSTTLEDDRGNPLGEIIYLTDVTDLHQREQRLSVLNRILRHNIRNELTVTRGNLELIEPHLEGESTEFLHTARQSIDTVLEFSEKARLLEDRLDERSQDEDVDIAATVQEIIDRAREAFPTATITSQTRSIVEGEDSFRARTVDGKLLNEAIMEVIENAIEHNTAAEPRVEVELVGNRSTIQVIVSDNGPGIPDDERAVLGSIEESALQHGSGLGLWFVEWTLSMSGGSLSFGDRDAEGSEVILALPRA